MRTRELGIYVGSALIALALGFGVIGLGVYWNHRPKQNSPPPKEKTNDIQSIETNRFVNAHLAEDYYQKAMQLVKEDAGYGLENILRRSEKWFRKAMAAGHPEAHVTLGAYYLSIDREESIQIYKEGAEMGIPSAMHDYATFHFLIEEEDEESAFYWFKKAAEGGHIESMWTTGIYYRSGYASAVEKDLKKAFKWFRLAAIEGDKIGMKYTAYMYFNGEGTHKSHGKAVEWWRRAYMVKPKYDFQKRDEIAAFYLGIAHLWGLGTPRNREVAESYMAKSGYWGKNKLEEELGYLRETGKIGKAIDFKP